MTLPQGAEWLVILAIVVLIFGARKLPELARGTGQALRIFRTETRGLLTDGTEERREPEPVPTDDVAQTDTTPPPGAAAS